MSVINHFAIKQVYLLFFYHVQGTLPPKASKIEYRDILLFYPQLPSRILFLKIVTKG